MKKINIFLTSSTILLITIILLIDNNTLNSIFTKDNNKSMKEVVILKNNYKTEPAKKVADVTHVIDTKNKANNTAKVASGMWKWPTENNYTITTHYNNSHKAIDISSNYGSNIYAINNGVVTQVMGGCIAGNTSCNGKGGNYIVINHNNGYYSVYMHLKNIKVKNKDTIAKGEVIGTMGNTGNVIPVPTSSAPYLGTHLHFAIYKGEPFKGGYPINPMNLY